MNPAVKLLATLVLVTAAPAVLAADSNYSLQDGGVVTVNPDTNRATVTRDGVTTPLWDGTHRLQDDSILIIRRGTSVPGKPVPGSRRLPKPPAEQWEGTPIVGYSPCEKLLRRVCGSHDQCVDVEGCNLARQLLTMEQDERAANKDRNRMTYTSGQCNAVRHDMELFPGCK